MTQQRLLHTYVASSCGASWGCWGGNTGGSSIQNGNGSSILADCIAQPNVGSGLLSAGLAGIVYGVNGVCHQMANRILSAANVELPLTFSQIRLSRFTYGGGSFGRNLQGQPADDRWPDRRDACTTSPSSRQSPSSVGLSDIPGNSSLSKESGQMRFSTGGHDDPDLRSELNALIEAASLKHPVGKPEMEALLKIQTDLHASQEQLGRWLFEKEITKIDYVAKLDAIMKEAARAGEEVLGYDDFHRVFGEFSAQSVLDVKAFVGGDYSGGFLAR